MECLILTIYYSNELYTLSLFGEQANPHAGTIRGNFSNNYKLLSQTPNSNASEEKDEEVELIVVPSAVKIPEEKDESRITSTNSKKEETLTEPQKEKKDFSTDTLEDNHKIQAFRRVLEEIALKHLGKVPMKTTLSVILPVVKACMDYIKHQSLYATLSTFLEKHGYKRGTIDKTLFIKRDKKDIMLVQVYVDDIIFGSTNKSWCDEFEALMKSRFQMSSMGELTFFLGLQVKQNKAGIFISQDKYVAEILKKFDLVNVKAAITPMETKVALTKDEEAIDVDVHLYRSMIGSLMYLTASRPDIMYATNCLFMFISHFHNDFSSQCCEEISKYLKATKLRLMVKSKGNNLDLEGILG
ncbi:putative ribonuclease H-like domain-containing protein [Tanacetum coccineum]|uniref:Ribonuclease H-like domain-containing protein n=1 Tax=Tanacetum coccineum TaxID=301880 RepID=A0ABQ5J1D9_9ASTR